MNSQLLDNIEKQTQRLLQQLKDLEECKEDMSPEEYEASKTETIQALEEFETILKNTQSGDLSLLSKVKKAQLEVQEAIKQSFNTQEIKKGFSSSEGVAIREKLKTIERHFQLKKIQQEQYIKDSLLLINQLDGMKIELTKEEKEFLDKYTGKQNFVKTSDKDVDKKVFNEVKNQLDSAK